MCFDRQEQTGRKAGGMKKWIFLAMMLGVMAVIFVLSAQPGEQSYALSAQLAQQLQQEDMAQAAPGWFSADFHANLRKWAHVWLYCLLGVTAGLAACGFLYAGAGQPAKRLLHCAGAALAVCLLYAAGDELHQYFVPGRACLATDILVDALGFAPCVLAVCGIWHWLACRRARRRQTGDPNAG